MDFIKKINSIFSSIFKARLFKLFIMNVTFATKLIYNIIKTFLKKGTVQKFILSTNSNDPNLL